MKSVIAYGFQDWDGSAVYFPTIEALKDELRRRQAARFEADAERYRQAIERIDLVIPDTRDVALVGGYETRLIVVEVEAGPDPIPPFPFAPGDNVMAQYNPERGTMTVGNGLGYGSYNVWCRTEDGRDYLYPINALVKVNP